MAPSIQASSSELIEYVKRELLRATADARRPWRFPVLVTANDGRVVVLRGIDTKHGSWQFFTDSRSLKAHQLEKSGGVATATFYHPKHRSQLRLKGVTELAAEDQRQEVWNMLTVDQKSSYGAQAAPGTAVEVGGDGLSGNWTNGTPTDDEKEKAYDHFGAYSFKIMEVDLLILHKEGHRRCRWKGWGGEDFTWLVP